MITYLVTQEGRHAIDEPPWLSIGPVEPHFQVLTYGQALHRRRWQAGTVIFTDIDRIAFPHIADTTELWNRLNAKSPDFHLVHHPARTPMRYPFLRRLYVDGINSFNVYRADEQRAPKRFPVFLHGERDHRGPVYGRIQDSAQLDQVLSDLADQGTILSQVLITEFVNTRSPDGLFRKYGIYMIGDRIMPRSCFYSNHWNVKDFRHGIPDNITEDQLFAEELDYIRTNPHQEIVRPIFEMAGIAYGRMDYAMRDGKIEVWEINTNPVHMMSIVPPDNPRYTEIFLPFNEWLHAALLALPGATSKDTVEIEPVRTRRGNAAEGQRPDPDAIQVFSDVSDE